MQIHISVITDNNNNSNHASHSLQHIATQEGIKSCHRRRLCGWSGRYYLSACRRARSAMTDRTMVYEKHASIKEFQNEGARRFK
jgi:hypothetical protein